MLNVNENTHNNTNEINNSTEVKGEKTMRNTIKETRIAEAAAKEAEAKAVAREERLAAIEPVDIVGTMTEVMNDTARAVRDEEGHTLGTNGGKLFQEPVVTPDGQLATIAAESKEALAQLKVDITEGKSGDGMFHQLLVIGGVTCDCCGATKEELEADIAAAEDYAQAHIQGSVIRDIDVAEQLVDAGYKQEELEQVTGCDGNPYLNCYNGNYTMNLSGETMADLDDLNSKLSKEDIKTILSERLDKSIEEREERGITVSFEFDDPEDDEEYYDDDEYDEYDED